MAISGILRKVFGSKSDRDMKLVKPFLDKVLAAYGPIDKLSNDELRAKTDELKAKLRECEAPFEKGYRKSRPSSRKTSRSTRRNSLPPSLTNL